MPPRTYQITADMSHLMWQAKVEGLSGAEIHRRYLALREQHLQSASGAERDEVRAELDRWAERIASVLNPAFLDQAI
ncbi:hypothetical protein [Motiliproteus sediminis]|uniref:hypothetical protein n=1 Tax=Motiliproteus sediminis TaxID=1468178 RepID=UPI001AEF36DE|nr:hypothetical protein [Motiliproteus sediminis]